MITKTERKSLSARDFSDDNMETIKKVFTIQCNTP